MSKPQSILGRELGQAICKHFGIDTAKHTVSSEFEIKTAPGELAAVNLTLMLSADDLAGIARAAGAEAEAVVDAEAREILRRYGVGLRDTRLDEIADLLKRIDDHLTRPLVTVSVAPGE